MFYHYRQNNSGGRFDFDDAAGIGVHVIIEAPNAKVANAIFESKGIEFGVGCSCCGPRWSEAWSSEGSETPMLYGQPAAEYKKNNHRRYQGEYIYIHYMDGRVEKI